MSDEIFIPRVADGDTVWKVARWVLMLAHLYYDRGVSIVDDAEFDAMCEEVADHFGELPEHERTLLGEPETLRHTGMDMLFSRLIVAQAERMAKDLGAEPGPYTAKWDYQCECCGCDLAAIRG